MLLTNSKNQTFSINHIWFDFSECMAFYKKENHDRLKYQLYSEATNRELNNELKNEYDELYIKYNKSNIGVFYSLGFPTDFFQNYISKTDPRELYQLAQENLPQFFFELSQKVEISLFSGLDLTDVLPPLGIDIKLFKFVLSVSQVGKPKPALDGYHKIIELSQLPPEEILYIGDDLGKDVVPAKTVGIKTGILWNKEYVEEADFNLKSFDELCGSHAPVRAS